MKSIAHADAAVKFEVQLPKALLGLRTGGRRQFRTQILRFFGDLIDQADEEGRVEVRTSDAQKRYGVTPATLSRWLAFFARRGWIRRLDRGERGPGRGRGVLWEVTWLTKAKKARERAYQQRLQEAKEVRRQFAQDPHLRELETEDLRRATDKWYQKRDSDENIKQRMCFYYRSKESLRDGGEHSSPAPFAQDQDLLLEAKKLQEALEERLVEGETKPLVLWAFRSYTLGRMKGQREPPSAKEISFVHRSIAFVDHIPIPRWAKDAASVFRWVRSLWQKLLEFGAKWWRKLRWSLTKKASRLEGEDSRAARAERAWLEQLAEDLREEEAEEHRREARARTERETDSQVAWEDYRLKKGKPYLALGGV